MNLRLLLFILAAAIPLAGCSTHLARASAAEQTVPEIMRQYGCPACHLIPRVPGASGSVGPSLAGLSQRSYLAGSLPNTPGNLQSWIMHPQHFRPGVAMPEMGVTEQDARRIAEFLERTR